MSSQPSTSTTAAGQADSPESVEYDPSTGRYTIFECLDCGNTVLALGRDGREDPSITCHGEPMERVATPEMDVQPPDLRQVLLQAFGLPKSGLDICLHVIEDGPLTANEVADALDYDRSTVTRYLNKLVELGLLRQVELNRKSGGVVNVYRPVDIDRIRRESLIGFYVWAGEAAARIEETKAKMKQRYLEDGPDREFPAVFWKSCSAD